MSNNLSLLISPKLSEIAGKLTPGNPNFWSAVAFPDKSISFPICCLLVHLLVSFCGHNLNASLTCLQKGFCQQSLFFWNILLGSGDKDFLYFLSGSSNTPIAFLLIRQPRNTSSAMYAGILSIWSLISMLLYTDVEKGDLRLLNSWDLNTCPNLKPQHEKSITLPTKKNIFNFCFRWVAEISAPI